MSGELTFHAIRSDEIEFIHADENTIHARYSRSNYNGAFRYLGVYARRDGAWKLLISTARRVAA